jgi:hypothetical protein
MAAPKLVIRKRMQFIQGKMRPCCWVQADVAPELRAILDEHFLNEALFKRAAYAQFWPEGALAIPAALAPSLNNFLKNDACPEITVKTLLQGQLHQGATAWEMMSFELVAKLAFENFLAITVTAQELNCDLVYEGAAAVAPIVFSADDAVAQLEAMASEMAA